MDVKGFGKLAYVVGTIISAIILIITLGIIPFVIYNTHSLTMINIWPLFILLSVGIAIPIGSRSVIILKKFNTKN